MSKIKSFQLIFLAMIVLSILFPFLGQSSTEDAKGSKGVDLVKIALEADEGKNEMPAVSFKHNLHTQAVEGNCAECHEKKDNVLVLKFKRTDEKATMDFYHDACVACHLKKKEAQEPYGPAASECRACHIETKTSQTSWEEIVFDRSLHYSHESSDKIKGQTPADTDNCSSCHHQANEKTKEIFYVKGEESSCSYCHKDEKTDGVRSMRQASHDSCVVCHQRLKEQKIEAGPVTCDGCHDKDQQLKIKKNSDIPRLKRNQPDQVAITGWKEGVKEKKAFMNAVAFNHKLHEMNVISCKDCHHQTLKKCSDCHTVDGGDAQGGFVSLAQAMHDSQSTQSCVGCHKNATQSSDCAGCHAAIPVTKDTSDSCKICHAIAPEEFETGQGQQLAQKALADLKNAYEVVPVEKIPEVITIDILAKDYKPSKFPHRKVVQAIFKRVEKSGMAKAFHGDQLKMCVGCHHNSPETLEPPKCASCHSKNGPLTGKGSDGRPGLKGAYHLQCIGCHQKMEIKSVTATDCVKCHEARK